MTCVLLNPDLVVALHDSALNPGELSGLARDKSLDGALARVENRLVYGMINDVFDLASSYAEAIARGHCFNDGNKRTSFQAMNFCLFANGVAIDWPDTAIADRIIALARGDLEAGSLADHLRASAGG